jgi:hypothetical protein
MNLKNILINIFWTDNTPKLGRWALKSCHEVHSVINSIYQNRDHCGDTICKTPKQDLSAYMDLCKKVSNNKK